MAPSPSVPPTHKNSSTFPHNPAVRYRCSSLNYLVVTSIILLTCCTSKLPFSDQCTRTPRSQRTSKVPHFSQFIKNSQPCPSKWIRALFQMIFYRSLWHPVCISPPLNSLHILLAADNPIHPQFPSSVDKASTLMLDNSKGSVHSW